MSGREKPRCRVYNASVAAQVVVLFSLTRDLACFSATSVSNLARHCEKFTTGKVFARGSVRFKFIFYCFGSKGNVAVRKVRISQKIIHYLSNLWMNISGKKTKVYQAKRFSIWSLFISIPFEIGQICLCLTEYIKLPSSVGLNNINLSMSGLIFFGVDSSRKHQR